MEHDKNLPPLTANEAAVWGAFLYEGLSSSHLDRKQFKNWKLGFIELIEKMCNYLPWVHDALLPYDLNTQDRPGVFEYEVISIFGEYLGDYLSTYDGELPTDEKIKTVIQELVDKFFKQMGVPHT